jgi:hypothetical protein
MPAHKCVFLPDGALRLEPPGIILDLAHIYG